MIKKQIIVPLGEYCVSTDPQYELVTIVGSCVAITLYDKKNQTGGLVHIVLPGKRQYLRENETKAYYADSGIPLLFEKLKKAGSDEDNLVAAVVGGASTLTEHDGNTIGKKNAEFAISLLKSKGIPIEKVDIAKKHGRRITLSIKNGKLNIENTTSQRIRDAVNHKESLIKFNLLLKKVEDLKPNEDVAGELLEVVHNHESTTNDIKKIISEDFILACHIFRLCNSPYYGFPGRISTFRDAVRLLGNRRFKLICVLVGTMRQRGNLSQNINQLIKKLSDHSYGTALIAEQVALVSFPEYKDQAYSAGLLHGVGVLGCTILQADTGKNKQIKAPFDSFRENNHSIAKQILMKWNIPNTIIKAVTTFETPVKESGHDGKLTGILHVACGISHLLGLGFQTSVCIDRVSADILRMMDLHEKIESIMPIIISKLRLVGILGKDPLKRACNFDYKL